MADEKTKDSDETRLQAKIAKRRRTGIWMARMARVIAWTLRYRMIDPSQLERDVLPNQPCIFVLWHNRLFGGFTWAIKRRRRLAPRRLACLVSPSADGEVLAAALAHIGHYTVRGSSSKGKRGSRAVMELLEVLKDGDHVAITPDGPRGPKYELKSGAVALARMSGCPLVSMRVEISWKFEFKKAWDRFQVPLPFGKCVLKLGEPLIVDEESDEEVIRRLANHMGRD